MESLLDPIVTGIDISNTHIRSFDLLVKFWLKNIVESKIKSRVSYLNRTVDYRLSNYRFQPPTISATEARVYNSSYTGSIYVDINETYTVDESIAHDKVHHSIKLCDFPVMLRSELHQQSTLLSDDVVPGHGGVFIIHGILRLIPLSTDIIYNEPLAFFSKKYKCAYVQCRSQHLDKPHRSTSTLEIFDTVQRKSQYPGIHLKLPFLQTIVPLGIMVMVLGSSIENFMSIVRSYIGELWHPRFERHFHLCRLHTSVHGTPDQCRSFLNRVYGKEPNSDHVQGIISSEILPHVNVGNVDQWPRHKLHYMALMTSRLILVDSGIIKHSTKEDICNIQVIDSGTMLARLFRIQFIAFIRQCNQIISKSLRSKVTTPLSVSTAFLAAFRHERLTSKLITAVATGTWSNVIRGVSQQLLHTNDFTIISQLQRIMSSNAKNSGKHIHQRMIRPDVYGYTCASETPEGEMCGLSTVLALTASVVVTSIECMHSMSVILYHLRDNIIPITQPKPPSSYIMIGDTGNLHGYIIDIELTVCKLRYLKRTFAISPFVTYRVDHRLYIIRIYNYTGQLIRPLLVTENIGRAIEIVKASHGILSHDLLPILIANNCIEYVSPHQEVKYGINRYTTQLSSLSTDAVYTEISGSAFLGILSQLTPFANHNQGPRLIYWSSMLKQVFTDDSRKSSATYSKQVRHKLWYAQRPIVRTRVCDMLQLHRVATGINCVVVFFPMQYNQEDAIVFNRASVDRGMFTSTRQRTYESMVDTNRRHSYHEMLKRPDKSRTIDMHSTSYTHIQDNGLPTIGHRVASGDVVVGKVVRCNKRLQNGDKTTVERDISTYVQTGDSGIVTSTDVFRQNDTTIVRVQLNESCIPEMGDKFSSRHSQKGTIGHLEDPENLPYSLLTGVVPDIVMSPLGFPSRMTIGKLIEALTGKVFCMTADAKHGYDEQQYDASATVRMEEIQDILHSLGFTQNGTETFICGKTGIRIRSPVMCGIVHYCKIDHMVSKKVHARATGPVHELTRQPNEGRRQNGGLRFGTMEVDALVAHATPFTLRERMMEMSDEYKCYICKRCGMIASGNVNLQYYYCTICHSSDHIRTVYLPYASKLLVHELMSTGIKTKLKLRDA